MRRYFLQRQSETRSVRSSRERPVRFGYLIKVPCRSVSSRSRLSLADDLIHGIQWDRSYTKGVGSLPAAMLPAAWA